MFTFVISKLSQIGLSERPLLFCIFGPYIKSYHKSGYRTCTCWKDAEESCCVHYTQIKLAWRNTFTSSSREETKCTSSSYINKVFIIFTHCHFRRSSVTTGYHASSNQGLYCDMYHDDTNSSCFLSLHRM